jgi:hypothetical protein
LPPLRDNARILAEVGFGTQRPRRDFHGARPGTRQQEHIADQTWFASGLSHPDAGFAR